MSDLFSSLTEIDLKDQTAGDVVYPEVVPGRVAHIDADFLCYEASAYTARERRYMERIENDPAADKRPLDDESIPRTFADMKNNALSALDRLRRACGAEFYIAHLTPAGSNKGRRGETAVIKEYQGARKDAEKPLHLLDMRLFISTCCNGQDHMSQEADDGMAQAAYLAHQRGREEYTVIASRDKDLNMVPGYYFCFIDNTVKYLSWDDSYGYIEKLFTEKSEKKKFKKLWGRGTAYFWAQCLMGDTVDNISGLPQTVNPETGKKMSMGPVAAYNLLKDAKSDAEAKAIVVKAWKEWPYEWKHWETGEPVTWYEALIGDMRSLWMRREKGQDVTDWLRTV